MLAHRLAIVVALALIPSGFHAGGALSAQGPASGAAAGARASYDTSAFAALEWRDVGPARGGRSVAVAGSAQRPLEYYMGTTGGGVFKTTDGGMNWSPVTDGYFGGTIGAITVDPQNPDVVWVGGGETCIRGNVSHGDGVWMTSDAGKTWQYMGLRETEQIARVVVDPRNSNVIFVAAMGPVHGPSADRGIYRSRDGGKSWDKVLFRNDSTGAIDLDIDPSNPDVMYAAFWQAGRSPWGMSSGGMHSGIFKTVDGGTTWTEISRNPGLPQAGPMGKIGLAVSPAMPQRIWALVEHDSGGMYRSDDGGATWQLTNSERKLRQRAWYYTHIYADPKDSNVVYALNVGFFRSRDGGKTFPQAIRVPHGDNHDLWIAPDDPKRMIEGNDGGANVSFTGGEAWTDQDFPTAQFYHVATTNEFPYRICGAQQDNSTLCGPSRAEGSIELAAWYEAGGCESGYVTPDPDEPTVTYAGCYGGNLDRLDRETGFRRDITVYPINPMGQSSEDIAVRFQWTFPIVFSRHDPDVLYAAGSRLFRTTNEGQSWTPVSPDLARADPRTMGPSGGPITKDQTGVETYALIFAFDESPITPGLLWAGTDDGLVHISRDNGATWKNVTPPDIGDFTRVSIIEPSTFDAGTAYVAANRYQMNDKRPYIWKTTDFGATWKLLVNGIPSTEFVRVVREDPERRGLLYAGTERGVWVSFDDGENWQSLQRNLPPVPVHDLTIKEGDLIAATHGRSFWVLDDLSALRQLSPEIAAGRAHLYKPRDTYRVQWGGSGGVGANPPSGITVYYQLQRANEDVSLDFLDANGALISSYTSALDSAALADSLAADEARATRRDSLVRTLGISRDSATAMVAAREREARGGGNRGGGGASRLSNHAGLNRFSWNLRYPDAVGFDGLIMWSARTTGPLAPPGTYRVRLRVAADTQVQQVAVRKDPRSPSTQADYDAQFRFLIAVRDTLSAANNAVRTVRNVRWQVDDRAPKLTGAAAAQFRMLADSMMTTATSAENEIYQTKNESNQDPLNYPIKLNNKIGALAGVAAGEYRPTDQTLEAFRTLTAELQSELTVLKKTYDSMLPRINALLKANGLAEIVPGTEELGKRARPQISMDDEEDDDYR
jgi:photosystem II stability/assembly factor-like uncharacterized protein